MCVQYHSNVSYCMSRVVCLVRLGGGGGGLLVAGMCLYLSSVLTSFKINFSVIIIMYVRIY